MSKNSSPVNQKTQNQITLAAIIDSLQIARDQRGGDLQTINEAINHAHGLANCLDKLTETKTLS